jgi:hypothetical protein
MVLAVVPFQSGFETKRDGASWLVTIIATAASRRTSMQHRLVLVGLLFCTGALAEPQIPEKLLGIWTTDGSTLQGERLISGNALYIDVDGVGAMVSVDGSDVRNSRLVETGYTASDHRLEVDLSGNGARGHLTLNYDELQNVIVPADDPGALYHRRKLQMSPNIRQALGLEAAPMSVAPPPGPRSFKLQ